MNVHDVKNQSINEQVYTTSTQKKHDQKQGKKKEIEKVSQTKVDLTKLTQNEEIPIVVTTNFDVDSFVKGYHEYKSIWSPMYQL